jgi:hypothetical protein
LVFILKPIVMSQSIAAFPIMVTENAIKFLHCSP